MSIKISVKHKQDFINMLLNQYQFKCRQCDIILTYLLSSEKLLQLTHFVDDITYCPRAISFSEVSVENDSFIFYKANIKTTCHMQAYHDLRLNNDEPIYINVNMPKPYELQHYNVLETNPFIVYHEQNKRKVLQLQQEQINMIKNHIDQALDDHNEQQFNELTKQLQTVLQSIQTV